MWLKDAWGQPLKLVKLDKKRTDPQGQPQFEQYDIVSAGPDGKLGTDDDVKLSTAAGQPVALRQVWWAGDEEGLIDRFADLNGPRGGPWGVRRGGQLERLELAARAVEKDGAFRGPFPPGAAIPRAANGFAGGVGGGALDDRAREAKSESDAAGQGGAQARRRGCASTSRRRCCGSPTSSPTTRAAPRCR